jgi:glycerophosphoryl diester phosphodiesterase
MTSSHHPPLIVHHMAALDGQTFPPNSLEAVRACLDHGADVVELDVTALATGDYLLVHDPQLESETTGTGPVARCTPQQARDLRCRVAGEETPYRVPLLSEVVVLFGDHLGDTRLQLDFKNLVPFADEEPLARLVDLVRPLGARVIVSSEADWQLRRLRRLAPWLDLGFDIHFYLDSPDPAERRHPAAYPRRLGAYGYYDDHPLAVHRFWSPADYLADRCEMLLGLVPNASVFYLNHRFLVRGLDDGFDWIDALHAVGVACNAWTVDGGDPVAERNARRLRDAGVDRFTTNTPLELRALLAEP